VNQGEEAAGEIAFADGLVEVLMAGAAEVDRAELGDGAQRIAAAQPGVAAGAGDEVVAGELLDRSRAQGAAAGPRREAIAIGVHGRRSPDNATTKGGRTTADRVGGSESNRLGQRSRATGTLRFPGVPPAFRHRQ
jgi:hypothetical protein